MNERSKVKPDKRKEGRNEGRCERAAKIHGEGWINSLIPSLDRRRAADAAAHYQSTLGGGGEEEEVINGRHYSTRRKGFFPSFFLSHLPPSLPPSLLFAA